MKSTDIHRHTRYQLGPVETRMIRLVDPSVEIIPSGSATHWLASGMEGDPTVLEKLGDDAHYLSLHGYVGIHADDTMHFLASPQTLEPENVNGHGRFGPPLIEERYNLEARAMAPSESDECRGEGQSSLRSVGSRDEASKRPIGRC